MPRDAICGAGSLVELAPGARVGTSSLRRTAQINALRDDLEVVEVRGNVDTRLRKLADGEVDALVLALAGLQRLGRDDEAGGVLTELVPAAGQGALAVEARAGRGRRCGALRRGVDGVRDRRARAGPRARRVVQHAGRVPTRPACREARSS